jgi:hypothetical protein
MNPSTVRRLENLGRIRLSASFFLRDFLHSEIANAYGAPNIPDDPDLAVHVGRRLCEEILEPLNATFGRIAIRSAYRSSAINAFGNRNKLGCASNERNYARHIWDRRDADDCCGATACVVIPWFADRYAAGADWRSLAYWIHDHLPYDRLQFFPKLAAFNIGWHERPVRSIYSFIRPAGYLIRPRDRPPAKDTPMYEGFPPLQSRPVKTP